MNNQALANRHPIDILSDGDLIYVDPRSLIDLSVGGNIRKYKRDPVKYEEVKESIRIRGISQPLTVRYNKSRTALELIAGYGRKNIAIELDLEKVPVLFRDVDDTTALAIAIEENIMREDMNDIDDIQAAKLYVGLCDGDYNLAANSLGWEVSKVRSRMQLTRCTKKVLDALADKEIKLGHATLLSVLTEKIQNNTVEKVISERWSIDILKVKLGKVQNTLSEASFDTTDCALCQHNSNGIQTDIFSQSTGIVEGKCNNNTCFQAKTTEALQNKKAELEERFGSVIFLTETIKERNTVSESVVGKEQFESGCNNCEKKFTILDDRAGYNAATITDQCLDANCYNDILIQLKKQREEEAKENGSISSPTKSVSKSKNQKPTSATKTTKKKAKVTAQLSQPLQKAIRKNVRELTASHLYSKVHIKEAVMAIALSKLSGIHDGINEYKLKSCLDLSIEELQAIQHKAIKHYVFESSCSERYLIETYRHLDKTQEVLGSLWKPTTEVLNLYTIKGLEAIARGSGFAEWYDDIHKEEKKKSFGKLASGKKTDFIKELVDTSFEWGNYAPPEYSTVKPS